MSRQTRIRDVGKIYIDIYIGRGITDDVASRVARFDEYRVWNDLVSAVRIVKDGARNGYARVETRVESPRSETDLSRDVREMAREK